jgi:hypothetical protein
LRGSPHREMRIALPKPIALDLNPHCASASKKDRSIIDDLGMIIDFASVDLLTS